MKYNELIQFDPIDSVIQLLDADKAHTARKLVQTYVISEDMAERLSELVFPQLQFEKPADNKGLMIVGNYGTGKSHLMSVISAVAEDASLLKDISNPAVREAAKSIAGHFKVVRCEIGAVTMSLRDIVALELNSHLRQMGISYCFPSSDKVSNNKQAFADMMDAFNKRYPDQGLLLVIDELLDFLRSRDHMQIVLDLDFLREVGEVCSDLRFRFMAGLQEALFDSSQFQFVADSLRRVKARFEQVLIAMKDVKYVIAQRLLKKNADQKSSIRTYLTPFAKFYGNLNARMDDFVNLFPVHPDYLDIFSQIRIVEKREALKTISLKMKSLLQLDLPCDYPGLIAFDSYWDVLSTDASFRSDPQIKEIILCSQTLHNLVESNFPRHVNKAFAFRIINGLSVHRLTVGDSTTPNGLTAEALRDELSLFDPMVRETCGKNPAEDMRCFVETSLRLISQAVSGQFLSATETDAKGNLSGQFYLDIKKTIDYDERIRSRTCTLSDDELNRAYYAALRRVMECQDVTVVTGYPIWQHELIWRERKAPRLGYLFFGTPDERSTAVPGRDYYLYFLEPYASRKFTDEKLPDEVFFRLKMASDPVFTAVLKTYASATLLSENSSGQEQQVYQTKAGVALKKLVQKLQTEANDCFEITYQGRSKTIQNWAREAGVSIRDVLGVRPDETVNFRDLIKAVSSICLSPHFTDQAPGYPKFSIVITSENREHSVREALCALAGTGRTKEGIAVLDALELLDGEKIDPSHSKYARFILDVIHAKGEGQVTNRDELLKDVRGLEYMAPTNFRLEPEWCVVVIASLIYAGEVTLAIVGDKFDASGLSRLAKTDLQTLASFKFLEKPKDWNFAGLKALCGILALPPGLPQLMTQSGSADAISQFQSAVQKLINRLARARHDWETGFVFWGQNLLFCVQLSTGPDTLDAFKAFLESVTTFNSPGKLKNFHAAPAEIDPYRNALKTLEELDMLAEFIRQCDPSARWLGSADGVLPPGLPWNKELADLKKETLSSLQQIPADELGRLTSQISSSLEKLKKEYIRVYADLHSKARLNRELDQRKQRLGEDSRLHALSKLSEISLMPKQQLNNFKNDLAALKACPSLTEEDLQLSPICPNCSFRPSAEPILAGGAQLDSLEARLNSLLDQWTQTLLKNLADPITAQNIQELLRPAERKTIQDFLDSRTLPDPLTPEFISILDKVLKGLQKVSIKRDDLFKAVSELGPAAPRDIKQALDAFIDKCLQGRDVEKVRIVIE